MVMRTQFKALDLFVSPKLRKHYAAALCLLTFAAILGWYSDYSYSRYRWTVATASTDLRSGITRIPAFNVDLQTQYGISLVVDRKLPSNELNCLLGIVLSSSSECRDIPSPIALTWVVSSEGQIVAQGTTANHGGGSWGSSVGRVIGQFPGIPGKTYSLEVQSLKDGSSLLPANPRFHVSVSPREHKKHLVNAQLLGLVSLLLAALGALWLVVTLGVQIFRRRTNEI